MASTARLHGCESNVGKKLLRVLDFAGNIPDVVSYPGEGGEVMAIRRTNSAAMTTAVASVRSADGTQLDRPLGALRADQVLAGNPWRVVRNRRGQRHFSGSYWSATTGGFVVYESRLELARCC
jgi:hypothetical protein